MIVDVDVHSPVPVYEQLRVQVRDMITSGTLPSGQRLPAIRRLAADLDLSPGTVARTYRELEADGLVTTGGRKGTRVAPRSSWGTVTSPTDARDRLVEAASRYATLARQLGVTAADALAQAESALLATEGAAGHHEMRPGHERQ